MFVGYGDPSSPARELVNRRFRETAEDLATSLGNAWGHAPSVRYLESVFASIQWMLFEALRAGPSAKVIEETKAAVWEAAMGMLHVARASERPAV